MTRFTLKFSLIFFVSEQVKQVLKYIYLTKNLIHKILTVLVINNLIVDEIIAIVEDLFLFF